MRVLLIKKKTNSRSLMIVHKKHQQKYIYVQNIPHTQLHTLFARCY